MKLNIEGPSVLQLPYGIQEIIMNTKLKVSDLNKKFDNKKY